MFPGIKTNYKFKIFFLVVYYTDQKINVAIVLKLNK